MTDRQWLEIGTIVSAQGLNGEVRVYPSSDFPSRFQQSGKRWMQHPHTEEINEIQLEKGRYLEGKNMYIIKLQGIENRDAAEALKNYKLLVPQDDRPPLEEDEYHVADLVGMKVYHSISQEFIGTVVDVYSVANDLLEVELAGKISQGEIEANERKKKQKTPKVLIPFVKHIVPTVDVSMKRIEIDPPSGLLDIF